MERGGERRDGSIAEGLLESASAGAERVEVGRGRKPRLRLDRLLELERGCLRLLDSLRCLALAELGERRAERGELAAARSLLGHFAERRE